MSGQEKGAAPPRYSPDDTPKESKVIVHERNARLYGQSEAKRGGFGPDANLTPNPRTTTSLKQKSRVVE